MDYVFQIGPAPSAFLGIETKDWLQFSGALLGALIAVILWFAERRRAELAETARRLTAKSNYCYAIALSAGELEIQLHEIITYHKTINSNCRAISEQFPTECEDSVNSNKAILSNILNRVGILYLNPAPILELSIEHARHLSRDQNHLLSEILSETRSINYQISTLSTDSVEEAVDTLNVVSEAASRASERVDSLLSLLGHVRNGDV